MKFPEKKYDKISYIAPSWEEMGVLCFNLAKQILDCGKKYDRVVALAKGGWTWARTLVDYLQIENIASMQIKFYSDVWQSADEPKILQSLSSDVKGENILLFDDVSDFGKTLIVAKKHVLGNGAKSVDSATLFYKPHSTFKPEYISYTTTAWVIFPHEVREIVIQAGKKWLVNGVKKPVVIKRFTDLGMPKDQIIYFLNLL